MPEKITAMAINSVYGVLAIGTYTGMALVDIVTYTLIYSWSNTELYGRESVQFSLPSQNSDASPLEVRICAQFSSPNKIKMLVQICMLFYIVEIV